MCRLF
jgi:hypothetical protein